MVTHSYIFLGPQGSGKGTQAQDFAKLLSIPHISTGEMFRQLAAEEDPVGIKAREEYWSKGLLVPDSLTNEMLASRLRRTDTAKGYILDGYPRNIAQAEFLEKINLNVTAIYLTISDNDSVKRITGRRTCSACGAVYHTEFKPPKVTEHCDNDNAALIQRADDVERVVRDRLATFHLQTEPLLDFYKQKEKLIIVDGTPEISVVTSQIKKAIGL